MKMATIAQLNRQNILDILNREAPELRRRFGVRSIGLFGSHARGEATPTSDIDILIDFENPRFDDYFEVKALLEELFGCPVDLALAHTLRPYLKPIILRETVYAA
jgi:predicted nucleotidyltransferase